MAGMLRFALLLHFVVESTHSAACMVTVKCTHSKTPNAGKVFYKTFLYRDKGGIEVIGWAISEVEARWFGVKIWGIFGYI